MAVFAEPRGRVVRLAVAVCLAAWTGAPGRGQEPAAAAGPQNQPEISTHEERATFTSHVSLVMVPVVVRDKQGKAVGGLTKEQFRLLDKGKPQEISRFAVERPGAETPRAPAAEAIPAGEGAAPPQGAADGIARRFIGYLFDDVHADLGDMLRARDAAKRHIATNLHETDRAAIFTTSGQGELDFTDDRDQLRGALERLAPHPLARTQLQECPDISFYQADRILNQGDAQALQAATTEALICRHLLDPFATREVQLQEIAMAQKSSQVDARRVFVAGEHETQVALTSLKDAVRRMSAMPGERVLVLVSPGFLTLAEHQGAEYDVIERALRGNVIINVVNARGLYTTSIDAAHAVLDSAAERTKQALLRQSEALGESLLLEMAADTGGTYFHNNNDLDEGFRRTATSPEVYYLLGFQPQNLKLDGGFHTLKVAIEAKAAYEIEARRGYFAPTRLEDATATAKREVEDAVYSREEVRDLPVELRTQFFKGADGSAMVTVLAHLDLKAIKFRKADGRNVDSVTVASVLFDRNGNFVNGVVKHLDLHLRDEFLQRRLEQGITVRSGVEVKPGWYAVRLVVRDSEGAMMSAVNGAVDIR